MDAIGSISRINPGTGLTQPSQIGDVSQGAQESQVNPYLFADSTVISGLMSAIINGVKVDREREEEQIENNPVYVEHEADLRRLSKNPKPTGTHNTLTDGSVTAALNDDPFLATAA